MVVGRTEFRLRLRALSALIGVAASAALIAACTTSEWDTSSIDRPTTTTEKTYSSDAAGMIESIADHLAIRRTTNNWAPTKDEATCAATAIVNQFGANRLADLGFEPRRGRLNLDYTDTEVATASNLLAGCIDVREGLLSMFVDDSKLSLTSAKCLTDGVDRRGLGRLFLRGLVLGAAPDPFAQDGELANSMLTLMAECLDPSTDLLPDTRSASEDTTTTVASDE